jgi:hypothetical protein
VQEWLSCQHQLQLISVVRLAAVCTQACCMLCWHVRRPSNRCAGSWRAGSSSPSWQHSRHSRCDTIHGMTHTPTMVRHVPNYTVSTVCLVTQSSGSTHNTAGVSQSLAWHGMAWHDTHANHGLSITQLHSVNCLPSHTNQWQHPQHSRCSAP